MDLVVLDQWSDLMILEVFSSPLSHGNFTSFGKEHLKNLKYLHELGCFSLQDLRIWINLRCDFHMKSHVDFSVMFGINSSKKTVLAGKAL